MKIVIITLAFFPNFFYLQAQNAWQQQLLQEVNTLRQTGCRCGSKKFVPVPVLTWSTQLELAANNHAIDMNTKHYFDHRSRNGNSFAERIEAAKYHWERCGENIANGQKTASEVFSDWKKSPSHCKNMMSPEFKEMGAARSGNYWVQDFGRLMTISKK